MAILSGSVNNSMGQSNIGGTGSLNGKSNVGSGGRLNASAGQLVKGTVTDIHDSQITILRDDGTSFTGQISDASQYSIGQRAAFEVINVSAKTILMKALSEAYLLDSNDTAFKALEEAGLPKSPRNIDVVRTLLNTQQSISKESILNALRFCSNYPEASIDSVLTMKYLSMPMTKETLIQFEQYQNKAHQLINKMDALTNSINEVLDLVGKKAPNAAGSVGLQFLDMALENLDFTEPPSTLTFDTSSAAPGQILASTVAPDGTPLPKGSILVNGQLIAAEIVDGRIILSEGAVLPTELKELIQNTPRENITLLSSNTISDALATDTPATDTTTPNTSSPAASSPETVPSDAPVMPQKSIPPSELPLSFTKGDIGNTLSKEALTIFHSEMEDLPLPEQLKQSILNGDAPIKDVLNELRTILPSLSPETVEKLFSSREFQTLLKEQILSGWTLSPEETKDPENIGKLYEKLEQNLKSISTFSETVLSQKSFSDMGSHANNMHDNLNFIKLLNQDLSYMQLPLKLSKQNAHGDLYIMTKKEALKKHPDKLRVLLHLELDHLGTLDIHIEKENTNIKTRFYVEDKKIMRLFERNIELLSDSFIEQGYLLTNETHLHEKEIDIVKDFIAEDLPIGDMKRYHFDLRA